MLKLILPTTEFKDQVLEYKEEFIKSGDSMDGTGGLRGACSFREWYARWNRMLREETVPEGFVPGTTYLAVNEENRLIGMVDLRHRLNENLLQYGGHIGYSVRRSERRKGYATEMLALALNEARKLGLKKVLITCDKENIGSAKTIQNNGGILENEVAEGERTTQRYWIVLE